MSMQHRGPPIAEFELCLDHGESQRLSREQAVGPDKLFWATSEVCVGVDPPHRDCNLVVSVARADAASYAQLARRVYASEDDTVYISVRVPRRENENVREVQCFLADVYFEDSPRARQPSVTKEELSRLCRAIGNASGSKSSVLDELLAHIARVESTDPRESGYLDAMRDCAHAISARVRAEERKADDLDAVGRPGWSGALTTLRNGPLDPFEIAERMGGNAYWVGQMLNEMVEHGLVQIAGAEGRSLHLRYFLTARGLSVLADFDRHPGSTVRRLRREITIMREAAERRNRQLDALGIVWCDGGCPGGMRRYTDEDVTAEDVAFLLHNAARARSWFENRAAKGHEDFVERGQAAADSVIQRLSERHEREIAALKRRLHTATQALDQILKDCENIHTANAAALVDVIYSEVKAALGKIDES